MREPEIAEVASLPASTPLLQRWAGIKASGEESMSLVTWIQAGQKGGSRFQPLIKVHLTILQCFEVFSPLLQRHTSFNVLFQNWVILDQPVSICQLLT